jgi:carboxymethylenebutenolidase
MRPTLHIACSSLSVPTGCGAIGQQYDPVNVDIETPDGVANAYLARPDDQPYPGVLFVMDAFGLRPAIEQMVDRIAADGYVVLAPNVFYRSARTIPPPPEDPEKRGEYFASTISPLLDELTPERIAADGEAYLDALSTAGGREPVAITGYCMGGRVGWWIANAHADRVAALAGFHVGGLVTEGDGSPHRSVPDAELHFAFADEDPNATPEQIATLAHALDEAGVRYHAEVYEGAKHGYTMVDSPVYDRDASERHFGELRALLERTLG